MMTAQSTGSTRRPAMRATRTFANDRFRPKRRAVAEPPVGTGSWCSATSTQSAWRNQSCWAFSLGLDIPGGCATHRVRRSRRRMRGERAGGVRRRRPLRRQRRDRAGGAAGDCCPHCGAPIARRRRPAVPTRRSPPARPHSPAAGSRLPMSSDSPGSVSCRRSPVSKAARSDRACTSSTAGPGPRWTWVEPP